MQEKKKRKKKKLGKRISLQEPEKSSRLVGHKTRVSYSYFAPAREGPAESDSNMKET